jgi:hypothetical protein
MPSSEETAIIKRGRFAETTMGYVHIDVSDLRCAEGKVHMFLAIDRVSKFTYVELHPSATVLTGAAFLRSAVATFPHKLHSVLTDNGIPYTDRPDKRSGPTAQYRPHVFERVCRKDGITHKLTKPYHRDHGQAERLSRTVKEATVRAFHYETLDSLKAHLDAFIAAYDLAKHLKSLRWRNPFQAICDAWTADPTLFTINGTTSFRDHTPNLKRRLFTRRFRRYDCSRIQAETSSFHVALRMPSIIRVNCRKVHVTTLSLKSLHLKSISLKR